MTGGGEEARQDLRPTRGDMADRISFLPGGVARGPQSGPATPGAPGGSAQTATARSGASHPPPTEIVPGQLAQPQGEGRELARL